MKTKNFKVGLNCKSVGSKLIFSFIVVAMVISLTLGIVCSIISKKALYTLCNETLPHITEKSGEVVSEKINTHKEIFAALCTNKFLLDNNVSFKEKKDFIKKYVNSDNVVGVEFVDLGGKVISNNNSTNISNRQYFIEAVKNKKVTMSPPMQSIDKNHKGEILITYCAPIFNGDEITRYLIADVKIEEITDVVKGLKIGQTGNFLIIDNVGNVIASDKKEEIGKVNLFKLYNENKEYEKFGDVLENAVKTDKLVERSAIDNKDVFVSSCKIKGTNWTIMLIQNEDEILSSVKLTNLSIFVISIICLIIGVIIVFIQVKQISKAMKYATDKLNVISKGDLSIDIDNNMKKRKDEFGIMAKAMEKMQYSVSDVIKSIKDSAVKVDHYSENLSTLSEEISASSENVFNSIQEVAKGNQCQSNDMNEIVTILENFNEDLELVMNSINEIKYKNDDIYILSQESNGDMDKVIASSKSVNISFEDLMDKVSSVEEDITKINEIISVINAIAEQTNLLALNAAIEAARAGDVGKGFTVVADEIRKLAEQSKISASNITSLLKNVYNQTNIMVNTTEVVKEEIMEQQQIIEKAMNSFEQIKDQVEEIKPKIEESQCLGQDIIGHRKEILDKVNSTFAVSEEVSASSEEITAMVEELSTSTTEVTSAAEELTTMTKIMKDKTELFKIKE